MNKWIMIVAILAVGYFLGVYFPTYGQTVISKASTMV